jgi:hypothetical protein
VLILYFDVELFVKIDPRLLGVKEPNSVAGAVSISDLELLVQSSSTSVAGRLMNNKQPFPFTAEQIEAKKKEHKVLTEELNELLKELRKTESKIYEITEQLQRDTIQPFVAHQIKTLQDSYRPHSPHQIVQYLEDCLEFIVNNTDRFGKEGTANIASAGMGSKGTAGAANDLLLSLLAPRTNRNRARNKAGSAFYNNVPELQVNLLVDNSQYAGSNTPSRCPIVMERFPS